MANEPLTQILARLPEGADFDAAYAALMATEQGREFLAEFARRNRHADTQMVVAALRDVEAAVRGEPAPQSSSGLPEIVSEVEQIESGLAGGSDVDDISAAIERLHDVAFGLHEQLPEHSLRDTFDGAVRKLSDALTQPAGMIERRQQAIVQLRALAERLQAVIGPSSEIIQPAPVSEGDQQSVVEAVAASANPVDTPMRDERSDDNQQVVVDYQSVIERLDAEPENPADTLTSDGRTDDSPQAVVDYQTTVEQLEAELESPADTPTFNERTADDPQGVVEYQLAVELLETELASLADMPASGGRTDDNPQAVVEYQSAVELLETELANLADTSTSDERVEDSPQGVIEYQSAVEQFETAPPPIAEPIERVYAIESAGNLADVPTTAADIPASSGSVLDEVFESDAFSRLTVLTSNTSEPMLPPNEAPGETAPNGEPVSEQLLPSQIYSQDSGADPQGNPDDIFDAMPMPSPLGAAAAGEMPVSEAEPDIFAQRGNMIDATRSVPRPAASDPLAAVRDLSEEELIALFT